MKYFITLGMAMLFLIFASMPAAYGQHSHGYVRCHTHEHHTQQLQNNPQRSDDATFEQYMAREKQRLSQSSHLRAGTVYTIPVIFHIIHDNEAVGTGDNISQALVNAQIEQLNHDFRKVTGTSGDGSGVDTEIEFCPAVLDESGNLLPEPGINRIDRNTMSWTAPPFGTCNPNFNNSYIEGTIKPDSQWDPTLYFNTWVMGIDCGILGYAQFPEASTLGGIGTGNGIAATDGVVLLSGTLGSTGQNGSAAPYDKGRTATHEVGHWLGLRHIWGDGNCSVDDFCADTPTSDAANYSCPTGHVSCTTTDNIQNYMDYTDDSCMDNFSQDQTDRMRIVMGETGLGSVRRAILASSDRCTSTPSASFTNFTTPSQAEGTTNMCGTRNVTAQVRLSAEPSATTTVTISTSGTATGGGDDYTLSSGTSYTFTTANWNTPQDITLAIEEDAAEEADETIILDITSVTGSDAVELGTQQITLTLENDDEVPSAGNITVIWTEDFSTTTGWSVSYSSANTQKPEWTLGTGCTSGTNGEINGSTAFIYDNDAGTGYCGYWQYGNAETARLFRTVDATGLSNLEVTFSWVCGGEGTVASPQDYGALAYRLNSTDPFTIIPGTTLIGQTNVQTSTFTLPATLDNTQFELAWLFITDNDLFNGSSSVGFGLSVDDITVRSNNSISIASTNNTASGFAEHNLGPNQTVHFYDQSSGDIMCSIENLSTYNYGCTRVEIDNAGTGSTTWIAGQNVTSKTFKVTPEFNNASGNYNITVYYEDAELGGLVAASMAKAASGIDAGSNNADNSEVVAFTAATFGTGKGYTASFTSGFSGFALSTAPPSSPLPVELLSFTGRKDGKVNVLDWATASELDNSHFEVQRSTDGRAFEAIGKVEGYGTTSEEQSYRFVDENPTQVSYYRLKQVDFSGDYAYSDVVLLKRELEGFLVGGVFPSPTKGVANIRLEASQATALELTIVDVTGKVLRQQSLQVEAGSSVQPVDISGFAPAVYFFHLDSGLKREVIRVVKD